MIKWRILKPEDIEQVKRLLADRAPMAEVLPFAMSLIESWDFLDPDTGQPVPAGAWGELTMEQFNEFVTSFNEYFSQSDVRALEMRYDQENKN